MVELVTALSILAARAAVVLPGRPNGYHTSGRRSQELSYARPRRHLLLFIVFEYSRILVAVGDHRVAGPLFVWSFEISPKCQVGSHYGIYLIR